MMLMTLEPGEQSVLGATHRDPSCAHQHAASSNFNFSRFLLAY